MRRKEIDVDVLIAMVLLLVTMLGASLYLAHHLLVRLPFAPDCPTCRCVTAQPVHITRVDRLLAHRGVAFRSCPRCGWAGRMRWRLAAERVRSRK